MTFEFEIAYNVKCVCCPPDNGEPSNAKKTVKARGSVFGDFTHVSDPYRFRDLDRFIVTFLDELVAAGWSYEADQLRCPTCTKTNRPYPEPKYLSRDKV